MKTWKEFQDRQGGPVSGSLNPSRLLDHVVVWIAGGLMQGKTMQVRAEELVVK